MQGVFSTPAVAQATPERAAMFLRGQQQQQRTPQLQQETGGAHQQERGNAPVISELNPVLYAHLQERARLWLEQKEKIVFFGVQGKKRVHAQPGNIEEEEQEIENLKKANVRLQEQVKNILSENERLQKHILQELEEKVKLQNENEELQAEQRLSVSDHTKWLEAKIALDEAKSELTILQAERGTLLAEKSRLDSELETLQNDFNTLRADNSKVKGELDILTEKNKVQDKTISEYKTESETMQEKIAGVTRELDSAKATYRQLGIENSILRNEFDTLQTKYKKLIDQENRTQQEVQDLSESSAKETEQMEKLKLQVKIQQGQIEALKLEIADLEGGRERQQIYIGGLEETNSTLRSENADLLVRIAKLGKENGDQLTKIATLQRQIAALQNEVDNLEATHAAYVQEIAAQHAAELKEAEEKHGAEVAKIEEKHTAEIAEKEERYDTDKKEWDDALKESEQETKDEKAKVEQLKEEVKQLKTERLFLNPPESDSLNELKQVDLKRIDQLKAWIVELQDKADKLEESNQRALETLNQKMAETVEWTMAGMLHNMIHYALHMLAFQQSVVSDIFLQLSTKYKIEKSVIDNVNQEYAGLLVLGLCRICAQCIRVIPEHFLGTEKDVQAIFVRGPESVSKDWDKIQKEIQSLLLKSFLKAVAMLWMTKVHKNLMESISSAPVDQKRNIANLIMQKLADSMENEANVAYILSQVMIFRTEHHEELEEKAKTASGVNRARELDKEYARMVAGAIQAHNISQVWGPVDGVLLNSAETRQMQEDLYSELAMVTADEELAGTGKRPGSVRLLAEEARRKRMQFNEGWNDPKEIGILPVVVDAETNVICILCRNGNAPASIEKTVRARAKGDCITNYARLLRRHSDTRAVFAKAVGMNMLYSALLKTTARPTRMQKDQAVVGVERMMFQLVTTINTFSVQKALVDAAQSQVEADKFYFADYNS